MPILELFSSLGAAHNHGLNCFQIRKEVSWRNLSPSSSRLQGRNRYEETREWYRCIDFTLCKWKKDMKEREIDIFQGRTDVLRV